MKKCIFSLFCVFFLFGSLVFAEKLDEKCCDSRGCCVKPCCKLEKMTSILNLTEDQKLKIEKILKDFDDEKEVKKDKFGKEMFDLKNKKNNKIKEILNEEQKIQFIVMNTVGQLNKEKESSYQFKQECSKKDKKGEFCNSEKCKCKKNCR